MRKSIILLMALFTILGCEKEKETEVFTGGVLIRIENTSKFAYKDIKVILSEERSYGNLPSGANSAYQPFSIGYRFAYIEFKIDNKPFLIQPRDYVGEKPLEDGKYTYQINVEDTSRLNRQLNLTFKED